MPNSTSEQEILDAAKAPASVAVDGVSVTNRSSTEVADAHDRINSAAASKSKSRGILLSRLIPGSAAGR